MLSCCCSSSSPLRGDVLALCELEHALVAAFAAEPGLLGSSEGGGGIGDDRPVEPDHSAVELLRDPQQLGEIAAVGVGHQAVLAVVGQRYGFGDVVERDDWRDRAEDLLTEDGRV